jgi:hypothetical protein
MKKFLLLLTLGNFMIINVMLAQYITGEDNAGNYITWTNGSNQGFGFTAWDMWTTGTAGYFLASSSGQGFGNIDTDNKSFGMYGNPLGDNYANAQRLVNNWADGAVFSIDIATAYRNGNKGIDIFASGYDLIWTFNVGSDKYTAGGVDQEWSYSQTSIFVLTVAQNGSNILINLTRGSDTYEITINNKTFYGFKLYNGSTDAGALNNLFFNNLKVEYSNPLKVPATANVKIDGNVQLGVSESLTVNNLTIGGSNSFTLLSTVAGTASLITNGTVTGDVTVQRYVAGDWSTNNSGWHLISSPVTTQPIADFTTTGGGNGYDFYGYNEAANTWMNYKAAGFEAWNGSANFVVGRGYSISYQATQTGKAFEGILNNSNVTHTDLSLTAGQGEGWHLLGNPFASAIDWSNVNWVKAGFNSYAKVWVGSSYKDVTDDYSNIIPSANGFWVKASNATNTLTIPTQARTHNALNWLKSSAPIGYVILTAVEVENNMSQECIIRMKDESTDGFDENLDAPFMAGNAPQIYTVIENKALSMNSVPSYTNKTFELGFVKNIASVFTIQLNIENIPEGEVISLFDKKLNQYFELTKGLAYEFTSEPGDDPNRFLLHFGAVGVDEAIPATAIAAYVSNNILYVLNAQGKVQVDVLDLSGRMVYSQSMQAEGLSSTPINLSAGVYVVRLNDGQTTRANKVIVQ